MDDTLYFLKYLEMEHVEMKKKVFQSIIYQF